MRFPTYPPDILSRADALLSEKYPDGIVDPRFVEIACEAMMAASEWRDISTAPKDGSVVLVADDTHVTAAKYHEDVGRVLISADEPYWQPYDNSFWDRFETDDSWFQPTHWQPLPAPPKPTDPQQATPSHTEQQ